LVTDIGEYAAETINMTRIVAIKNKNLIRNDSCQPNRKAKKFHSSKTKKTHSAQWLGGTTLVRCVYSQAAHLQCSYRPFTASMGSHIIILFILITIGLLICHICISLHTIIDCTCFVTISTNTTQHTLLIHSIVYSVFMAKLSEQAERYDGTLLD
jgi:hypothetical protein